jgi:hypothetical protein
MLPAQLESELATLRRTFTVDVVEEPQVIDVVIHGFPVASPPYNSSSTNVLIRVPRAYPDAGLDMFWTDIELKLDGGGIPQGADKQEEYPATDSILGFHGKVWRRFSWHPKYASPGKWNPAIDNIVSYTEFVRKRLNQG